MNQWAFVIAAYVLVIAATAILLVASAAAMRRAERDGAALKDRR